MAVRGLILAVFGGVAARPRSWSKHLWNRLWRRKVGKSDIWGLALNSFFGALHTKLLLLRHTRGHYGGCWGVYGRWTGFDGHFFTGLTILLFRRRHGHASAIGNRAAGLAWAGSERHRRQKGLSTAFPCQNCLFHVCRVIKRVAGHLVVVHGVVWFTKVWFFSTARFDHLLFLLNNNFIIIKMVGHLLASCYSISWSYKFLSKLDHHIGCGGPETRRMK